jgi:hypothetical protein
MKALSKFKINPEKKLNNEELIRLRGGWTEYTCHVIYDGYETDFTFSSTCADTSCAEHQCEYAYQDVNGDCSQCY